MCIFIKENISFFEDLFKNDIELNTEIVFISIPFFICITSKSVDIICTSHIDNNGFKIN